MFRLVKILNGRTNQAEPMVLATNAKEAYALGEALCLENGVLTKCESADAPTYIAICDMEAGKADTLPVYPVSQDMIFECPIPAGATVRVGDKVTLASDGMGVTATTGGSAIILTKPDEDNLVLVTF